MFNFLYKKYFEIFKGVTFGKNVIVKFPCNLYKCQIDEGCRIGPFVEIQENARIHFNCIISSHCFIAAETHIGHDSFLGHSVVTANDKNPIAFNKHWKCEAPFIYWNCSIGSNANILPGVVINKGAKIGQGAVVTKDVPYDETWVGNPARKLEKRNFTKDLEDLNK